LNLFLCVISLNLFPCVISLDLFLCDIFAPVSTLRKLSLSCTGAISLQNTETCPLRYQVLAAHHVDWERSVPRRPVPTDSVLNEQLPPPTVTPPPAQSAAPGQQLVISTCVPRGLGCFLQIRSVYLHENTTFRLKTLLAGCCSDIPFHILIPKERKIRYTSQRHQSISPSSCSLLLYHNVGFVLEFFVHRSRPLRTPRFSPPGSECLIYILKYRAKYSFLKCRLFHSTA
jgi:hypothetical protein